MISSRAAGIALVLMSVAAGCSSHRGDYPSPFVPGTTGAPSGDADPLTPDAAAIDAVSPATDDGPSSSDAGADGGAPVDARADGAVAAAIADKCTVPAMCTPGGSCAD